MAVVFAARDVKHDREVAVKVLRPELSAVVGGDRFLREIRFTARLQHPHILPLYDSGQANELLFYVMPFVRGESLRERLQREHQLPVAESVALLRSVAGALDYAHRQDILHRDIKPENILLQDRQALLADFGIALAVCSAGGDRLTHTGISIGTPTYMSPEQVAGDEPLDARADIYALGCVGYELLAGEPPFRGRNTQAVIAAVMTGDPKPLIEHRRNVPDSVAAAIHCAIERLPADRFATAAEFASALDERAKILPRRRARSVRLTRAVLGGAVLGLAIGILLGIFFPSGAGKHAAVRRWSIALPETAPVALPGASQAIALSPAGDRLAYISPRGSTTALMVRPLDGDSTIALPGTEGAYDPCYSPDGAWIGFFAGNVLRKIPATGGDAVTIGPVDRVTGVAWPALDRILVFENEGFDLHWIRAAGAPADSVVHLATQFGTPDVLPGGRWAVGQLSSGQLALLSLPDGKELAITRRGVLPLDSVRQSDLLFGASPRWLSSGRLIYGAGDGVLMALPFDAAARKVSGGGEPVPLISGVRMEAGFGYAEFAISRDGTLIYVPGGNQFYVNLAFVTPRGTFDTLPFPRGPYTQPRISPDGKHIAAQLRNPIGGWQVLLMDIATGVRQPVNVEGNYRAFPASWLPSGRELMIGLWDPVQFLNYGARIQSLDTGASRDVHVSGASYMTIAPDGRSFVFSDWRTGDLYIRSLGDDTARIRIPARGFAASFSPDGRFVAWGGVNGAVEVSPVPPTGAIYRVVERGQMPLWTPQGDALIYRDGTRYYGAPVSTAGGFHAGRPRLVAEGPFLSTFAWNHAMSPDGRLLVLLGSPQQRAGTLGVVTGFPSFVEQGHRSSER